VLVDNLHGGNGQKWAEVKRVKIGNEQQLKRFESIYIYRTSPMPSARVCFQP
jgi:hypothetical protein